MDMLLNRIDEYCSLAETVKTIKDKMADIEADIYKISENDLENSKFKTVSYKTQRGNRLSVTYADSVKLIYPTMLKKIFGDCYNEVVTEKATYQLSESAKRMLGGLYLKDYIKDDFESIINQISTDPKIIAALKKRLKGVNFQKDKENIQKIAKTTEDRASLYAYFVQESKIWESFTKLQSLANNEITIDECLQLIDNAIVTEQTPKIKIES